MRQSARRCRILCVSPLLLQYPGEGVRACPHDTMVLGEANFELSVFMINIRVLYGYFELIYTQFCMLWV